MNVKIELTIIVNLKFHGSFVDNTKHLKNPAKFFVEINIFSLKFETIIKKM